MNIFQFLKILHRYAGIVGLIGNIFENYDFFEKYRSNTITMDIWLNVKMRLISILKGTEQFNTIIIAINENPKIKELLPKLFSEAGILYFPG